MAEYIDRQELLENLNKFAPEHYSALVNTLITKQPAADVVEIKHGKWEYDPDGNDWGLGAWCCSLCQCKNDNLGMGNHINPYQFAGSKYCPNCGAKMDEVTK